MPFLAAGGGGWTYRRSKEQGLTRHCDTHAKSHSAATGCPVKLSEAVIFVLHVISNPDVGELNEIEMCLAQRFGGSGRI